MPSNPELYLMTQLVNIPNTQVLNYHFITANEIVIDLKSKVKKVVCPHCQKTTDKVHQNHWYRVRDIALGDWQVFLNINRRQLRCNSCQKIFSEELDFIKKGRTYTLRLRDKVIREVLENNIKSAAQRNRITAKEIEKILEELESELLEEKPVDLKKLGLDEISQLKGGKNYCAVLVNIETGKPIALLKNRNKETIAEYLKSLGKETLEQIEEVSIDLWIGYKSVVEEMLPNAQIVGDRFHVMKIINEELDSRRKKEKREALTLKKKKEREEKVAGITHSKYPLLKKREKLNEEEKEKIEEVKKVAPFLGEMYEEKEKLRAIYEQEISSDEAFYKLIEWTENAYKYFPKSCKTISRWIDEIVAYFDNRTTQGVVEGINQKIKLIKRNAYGLTNFDNFRRRVLLNWHFS